MTFKIDPPGTVDIRFPKPKRIPGQTRQKKYPFAELEVGSSFFVPWNRTGTVEQLRKRLAVAGTISKKGTKIKYKAVMRLECDNDPAGVGVRVVRIA